MQSPRRLGSYPDRELDLQAALEDGFAELVATAKRAGWLPLEAYQAMIALAAAHACAELRDEAMADLLDQNKRQR